MWPLIKRTRLTMENSRRLAGRTLAVVATFVLAGGGMVDASAAGIAARSAATGDPVACTADGRGLRAAKANYARQCDAPRRDCDPVPYGRWLCSSAVIGANAPRVATVPDHPIGSPVAPPFAALVCTAGGRDLAATRAAYAWSCHRPRRDCDPLWSGGWRCSSAVIGTAAPRFTVPTPPVAKPVEGPVTGPVAVAPVLEGLGLAEQWNELALAGVRATGARPTVTTRQLFMISAAMYDAWAIHSPVATPWALSRKARRPAAEHTAEVQREAISQAAYRMLVAQFPAYEAKHHFFRTHLISLGYHPLDGPAHSPAGRGRAAAEAVLAERRDDGANAANDYAELTTLVYPSPYVGVNAATSIDELGEFAPGFDPDHWQPLRVPTGSVTDDDLRPLIDELNLDSFGDQRFLTPHWGGVTPFALSFGAEFRPSPPPFYGSDAPYTDARGVRSTNREAWIRQFAEVVDYSAELDDRDKTVAEFWADGPRTESPPGHWNQIAHGLIERDELDLGETVKLFFVLNAGLLDAGIATWEAKRHYDFIRPATAIRFLFMGRDIDAWGGPNRGTRSIPAATWSPFQQLTFVTPPFPEYVSGHSTFSRVAADLLTRYLGSDTLYDGRTVTARDIDGDGAPDLLGRHVALAGSSLVEDGPATDIELRWPTLRAAADEAGLSRLYGGIHIQDGDLRGRELGARVAERVAETADRYFAGEPAVRGRQPRRFGSPWRTTDGIRARSLR